MNKSLLFTISEACEIAKSGRSAVYDAINSGALRARKRGRKTLILAEDLDSWIKALPEMLTDTVQNFTTGRDPDTGDFPQANSQKRG